MKNTMMRFTNQQNAEDFMRRTNRAERQNRRSEFVVLVDGPEDDSIVMNLKDAIESEFLYRWSI